MKSNRKSPRFAYTGLLQISEQCGDRMVHRGAALARDLSETGVCLQMDIDLKVGSTILLKSRGAEVRAVVRNTSPVAQGFLVGVEFAEGFRWSQSVPGPFEADSSPQPAPISALPVATNSAPLVPSIERPDLIASLLEQIQRVHNKIKTTLGLDQPADQATLADSPGASGQQAGGKKGVAVFDDLPTPVVILDAKLNIKYANDAFVRVIGSSSLLTSRELIHFVVPEDLPRVEECARGTIQYSGAKALEFRVRNDAGNVRLLSSHWKYLRAENQTLVHLSDITHNRLEENELFALARQSGPDLKSTGIASWTWDIGSGRIECSRDYILLYGLDPATVTLPRSSWEAMLHQDDRERVTRAIEEAIANTGHICIEFRVVRPDGTTAWFAASGHVNYESGKPVSISGHTTDISGRKANEESARQLASRLHISNAALSLSLSYLPMGALIVESATGAVVASNDFLDRLFGGKAKAQDYRSWAAVDMTGRDYSPDRHPLMRSLSTGEIVTNERMCLFRVDRSLVPAIVSSMPIHNDTGELQGAITTLIEDVSGQIEMPVILPTAGAPL